MESRQNQDDSLLISEIRDGSVEAFEILYNRYKKKLYYFSYQYIKNHSDTEELLQTVFLSLWEHRQSLDDSLSIRNYIYRSAFNQIYDRLRKRLVHNKYLEYQIHNTEPEYNHSPNNLYYEDLKNSIDTIVDKLPAHQKNIFLMSRYENMSHKEIAEKLNLSVRTVETQIYRVLIKIRKKLML